MNFVRNKEKKIIIRRLVLYSRLTDFLTTVELGVLMRVTNSKLFLTKGDST